MVTLYVAGRIALETADRDHCHTLVVYQDRARALFDSLTPAWAGNRFVDKKLPDLSSTGGGMIHGHRARAEKIGQL